MSSKNGEKTYLSESLQDGLNKKPVRRTFIEGSLIAFGLTVLAYIYTYAYEAGYCKAFDIPVWFIRIEVSTMLAISSGFTLVLGPLITWYMLRMGQRRSLSMKAKIAFRSTSRLLPLLVLLIALIYPFKVRWEYITIMAIMIVIVIYVELVVPILHHHRAPRKTVSSLTTEELEGVFGADLEKRIYAGIDPTQLLIAALLTIGVCGAFLVGHSRASRELCFLIPSSPPGMVVLRVYEDRLICAPLDRKNQTVKRAFYFLKVPTDGRVALIRAKIGPLKSVYATIPTVPTDTLSADSTLGNP
jgi:uncharacterized Tic20 family protein